MLGEQFWLLRVEFVGGDHDLIGDGLRDVSSTDHVSHKIFDGSAVVERVGQIADHPGKDDEEERADDHEQDHDHPLAWLFPFVLSTLLPKHLLGSFGVLLLSKVDELHHLTLELFILGLVIYWFRMVLHE